MLRDFADHDAGFGQPAYLSKRACPVLDFRRSVPGAASEATSHPLSSVITWDGVGHWLHQERPEQFNSAVMAWLDR